MSAKGNGETRDRQHHDGSARRVYTSEQKAAVLRIRQCSPTAYYEILDLEAMRSNCSDADIKKAYRKLSLLTHPDKNAFQGADEAFKLVSKAFMVLSNPDQKAHYDRFGGNPSMPHGSPFNGFARPPGGAEFRRQEMSAEELFRQFLFGFDSSADFVFNAGRPDIRVYPFGGPGLRRRPTDPQRAARQHRQQQQQQQQPSPVSILSSLLPLLFLFILPLLSSLFSGSGSVPAGPSLRFDAPIPPHTQQRTSMRLHVPYWVNPVDVEDLSARKLKELDRTAEIRYMSHLNVECDLEQQRQAQLMQDAQGWFFIDEHKMREARSMSKPSCSRLRDLGYGH